MLVSCRYCYGVHERGALCHKKPKGSAKKKEDNAIRRFRGSRPWKKKRAEIKQRDLFLCQYCLEANRYIFQYLEVHHIIPIGEDWTKRLHDRNLITLCKYCHKQAEDGRINQAILQRILAKKY